MPDRRSPANPYLLLRARSIAPVLLTCEHARKELPPGVRATESESMLLRRHWGWDIGAWALTRDLAARLRTTAIGGRWSRLWIDLNRRVDDPELVRPTVEAVDLSWNRRLGSRELERRLIDCHAPYHERIDRLIVHRLVRGIRPLVFAIHTFTDLYEGRRRTFDAGVLFERDGTRARRLARSLRGAGLTVRYNEPYSGMAGMMYAADRHGKHHGLPCLELEINQALFRDARNVGRLGRTVAAAVDGLVASDPA